MFVYCLHIILDYSYAVPIIILADIGNMLLNGIIKRKEG